MLVLSRQPNESITLTLPDGLTIVVTVVRITPKNVRVGVEAPREVKILRTELLGTEAESC